MKEATRRGSSTARIPKIPWYTFVQLKDTLVGIWVHQNWWVMSQFHTIGLSLYSIELDLSTSSPLETGFIALGRESQEADKLSSSHFSTLLGKSRWKNPVTIYQYRGRCIITAFGNTYQDAQDQGLRMWQTKSNGITVHNPLPTDCIYRVISQNGDRTSFERLSTPRLAPRITLRRRWHTQQQHLQKQQQQSNTLRVLHRASGNRCEAPRCKTRIGRSWAEQQTISWHLEKDAWHCIICWRKGYVQNRRTSGRSTSRCHL